MMKLAVMALTIGLVACAGRDANGNRIVQERDHTWAGGFGGDFGACKASDTSGCGPDVRHDAEAGKVIWKKAKVSTGQLDD